MDTPSRVVRDDWAAFLAGHDSLVSATGLPSAALRSEDRFGRLLGEGSVSTAGTREASLGGLDARQWAALEGFCRAFFREFESYGPLEQFLAFKHELRRHGGGFRA
jgi:hypothetical protein